jgi:hypothetical protein
MCQKRSPESVRNLIRLEASDDDRVSLMASEKILTWAFGAPKQMDAKDLERVRMVLDLSKLSPEEVELLLKITRSGAVRPADPEQHPSDPQYDAQSSSDDAAAPSHGTINGTATEEPPLSFVRRRQATDARG